MLVGYGAIARRLAELLEPFGLHLVGFRRRPRGDEAIEVRPMAELSDGLRVPTGSLTSFLPRTIRLASSINRIRRHEARAIFMNIGRGATWTRRAPRALHSTCAPPTRRDLARASATRAALWQRPTASSRPRGRRTWRRIRPPCGAVSGQPRSIRSWPALAGRVY